MVKIVVAILAGLIPMAPILMYFLNRRNNNPLKTTQDLVLAFKGFNVLIGLMALGLAAVWLATPSTTLAAGMAQETTNRKGSSEVRSTPCAYGIHGVAATAQRRH